MPAYAHGGVIFRGRQNIWLCEIARERIFGMSGTRVGQSYTPGSESTKADTCSVSDLFPARIMGITAGAVLVQLSPHHDDTTCARNAD